MLLWTGAEDAWGSPEYPNEGSGLGRDGTLWLLDRGVKVIGTDAWGLDRPLGDLRAQFERDGDPAPLWAAHRVGIEREYCQIEKLAQPRRAARRDGLHGLLPAREDRGRVGGLVPRRGGGRWRPDPRASRRCCATTASRCGRASRSLVRSTTLAAPLLLALQEELLAREAWPLVRAELPGADEVFWRARARRAPRRLRRRRARRGARAPTRRSASRRRTTRARSRASTPDADRARRPRPRRRARGRARAALVRDAVADARRRPAGGDGHGRVRGLRAPRAVPRPRRRGRRVGRAARLPGAADRAAVAAPASCASRPRAPTSRCRSRAARGSTPTAGATCPPARSSPARTRTRPRAASASRSRPARAAWTSRASSSSSARAASSRRAPSAARRT